jgi:hypothetical protein
LRGVLKEIDRLPIQGADIVGERDSNHVSPRSATGRKVDLSSS